MNATFDIARKLPADFDRATHIRALETQGFTVIANYLNAENLQQFREALAPHLGTYRGRNPFEGLTTERIYTLVGRGKIFEDITDDPRLLSLLDRFLQPNYLLSANHAICIYPGEKAQALHFDDTFYPLARPRPAVSMSTIGAIDAFTPQNGGTVMYPGSHLWDDARIRTLFADLVQDRQTDDTRSVIHLTMPAGALCLFHGTLVHGAGANVSDAPRLAFTNHYCEPWARPQENFVLAVPKEKVREMSRELQILLGYELRRPGDIMGQVSGYHPGKTLDPNWVLPVQRAPNDPRPQ